MAWPIGCSEASSSAPASRSRSSASTPAAGTTSTSSIRPVVTVPVLSSTMVSTTRVDSSTSGPLIRMPSWAPRPVPTSSAVGRGQPEGAGAGDDQHRDGGGERGGDAVAGQQPAGQGGQGEGDHDGHEDRRDPVGEALDLGLAVLGVLDQPGHLRQLGVGADPGGADHQPAAGVHGGADDGVAGADLDGHRFAGEHGGVDRGGAVLDDAVGGDLLAGADDEPVADGELVDRDAQPPRRRGGRRRPWRPCRAGRAAPRRTGAWRGPRSSGRRG